MLKPLADRLLVKPLDEASASPGGILLPENMKHKEPVRGCVVSIGIGKLSGIQRGEAIVESSFDIRHADLFVLVGRWADAGKRIHLAEFHAEFTTDCPPARGADFSGDRRDGETHRSAGWHRVVAWQAQCAKRRLRGRSCTRARTQCGGDSRSRSGWSASRADR